METPDNKNPIVDTLEKMKLLDNDVAFIYGSHVTTNKETLIRLQMFDSIHTYTFDLKSGDIILIFRKKDKL